MSLPSIATQYLQIFQLYKRSYVALLPWLLLVIFFNRYIDSVFVPGDDPSALFLFVHLLFKTYINTLLLSIIIWDMNQIAQAKQSGYWLAFKNGLERSFQLFFAVILLSLPMILFSYIAYSLFSSDTSQLMLQVDIEMLLVWLVVMFSSLFYLYIVSIHCFLFSVMIVCQQKNAFEGIWASYLLVQGFKWRTFIVCVLAAILIGMTKLGLDQLVPHYSLSLINLLFFTLMCALMIVHERLLRSNQSLKTAS